MSFAMKDVVFVLVVCHCSTHIFLAQYAFQVGGAVDLTLLCYRVGKNRVTHGLIEKNFDFADGGDLSQTVTLCRQPKPILNFIFLESTKEYEHVGI